jgi:hypothetical protein
MSSPNPDRTEGSKHNAPRVPKLEYDYPKYSREPRFNWDKQRLVKQIELHQGIRGEVTEGMHHLCRQLGREPVYTTNSGYRQMPNK